MFVETVPKRRSRPTTLTRHSCREGRKVRKHALATITELLPEAVEKIRAVLQKVDLPSSPTPVQNQALRLLNSKLVRR